MELNVGARPLPYEIRVSPGWNLISIPRDPEETAIGGALAAAESLSTVMGYQNGDWLTARKTGDGWEGSLTELRGGYGYWALAHADETIPVALVRPDRFAPAPSVPVSRGWNLLGALDAERNSPGEPSSATDGNADRCFADIDWEVAYSLERNSAKAQRSGLGKNRSRGHRERLYPQRERLLGVGQRTRRAGRMRRAQPRGRDRRAVAGPPNAMAPSARERLLRISQAIEKIAQYTDGKDFTDYMSDAMLRDAVERNLTIIAEATLALAYAERVELRVDWDFRRPSFAVDPCAFSDSLDNLDL